jgi:hypothetical protein
MNEAPESLGLKSRKRKTKIASERMRPPQGRELRTHHDETKSISGDIANLKTGYDS